MYSTYQIKSVEGKFEAKIGMYIGCSLYCMCVFACTVRVYLHVRTLELLPHYVLPLVLQPA